MNFHSCKQKKTKIEILLEIVIFIPNNYYIKILLQLKKSSKQKAV